MVYLINVKIFGSPPHKVGKKWIKNRMRWIIVGVIAVLIGVKSKMPIRDVSVLSRIYTPGVGAVCKEIETEPGLLIPVIPAGAIPSP